jgi:hypothetical protein
MLEALDLPQIAPVVLPARPTCPALKVEDRDKNDAQHVTQTQASRSTVKRSHHS